MALAAPFTLMYGVTAWYPSGIGFTLPAMLLSCFGVSLTARRRLLRYQKDSRAGGPAAPRRACRHLGGKTAAGRSSVVRSGRRPSSGRGAADVVGGDAHGPDRVTGLCAERVQIVIERLAHHLAVAHLDHRGELEIEAPMGGWQAEPGSGHGGLEAAPVHVDVAVHRLAVVDDLAVRKGGKARRVPGGHRLPPLQAQTQRHVMIVAMRGIGGGRGRGVVPGLGGQVLMNDLSNLFSGHGQVLLSTARVPRRRDAANSLRGKLGGGPPWADRRCSESSIRRGRPSRSPSPNSPSPG